MLAGGHTIRDAEPKYGLAVVGTVHPDGIWPKGGARPGDALFLTKPLGTGLVLQAQREARAPRGLDGRGRADDDAQPRGGRGAAAVRAERRHRRDRLRVARPRATRWPRGAACARELDAARCRPPGRARAGRAPACRTGGDRRNREFAGPHVESTRGRRPEALAYDPQTAGGLLAALPAAKGAVLEAAFASAGLFLARIGRVETGAGVVARLSAWRMTVAPRAPPCARELAAAASADCHRDRGLALPDRRLGRPRPADRVGARLRQLAAAASAGSFFPEEGHHASSSSATASSALLPIVLSLAPGSRPARVRLPRWVTWLAGLDVLRDDRPGAARR